jgi:phosphoribosylformimino-5-aminoimidazole carboxamide ribonucleotide (ProFAR) isomerase
MKIVIVGSMAFHKEYEKIKEQLEKVGHNIIVPLSDEYYCKEKDVKKCAMLDFNKNLDKSDAILIANFEKKGIKNYIGINSIMEIGMAFNRGKKIFILHGIPENCRDELEAIGCISLNGELSKLK